MHWNNSLPRFAQVCCRVQKRTGRYSHDQKPNLKYPWEKKDIFLNLPGCANYRLIGMRRISRLSKVSEWKCVDLDGLFETSRDCHCDTRDPVEFCPPVMCRKKIIRLSTCYVQRKIKYVKLFRNKYWGWKWHLKNRLDSGSILF